MLVGLTSGSKAEFDLAAALHKRAKIIGTVLRGRSVAEKAEAVSRFAEEVVPLFAAGRIKANVDKVYKAEHASEADEYLESNKSFGKLVLEF